MAEGGTWSTIYARTLKGSKSGSQDFTVACASSAVFRFFGVRP